MRLHRITIILLTITPVLLAGCIPGATPQPATPSQPTPLPSTATAPPPTHTSPPPTVTATSIPAPTFTPTNAITSTTPLTLTAVHMADPLNGWGVGRTSNPIERILHTNDGGATWQDITPAEPAPASGDPAKIARLAISDALTAWVTYQLDPVYRIPTSPTVWRSTDGGLSWQPGQVIELPEFPEFYDLTDFQFVDPQNGWFIVHMGVGMNHDYMGIFRTRDGGMTWERIVDPFLTPDIQGCQKTGMAFGDPQIGWLSVDCEGVRDEAFFYRSADGGATWIETPLPPPADVPDLYQQAFCGLNYPQLFDGQRGVMALTCLQRDDFAQVRAFLYTTRDGGLTWQIFPYPGGKLAFLDPQVGWALGKDIFRTQDGGATWEAMTSVQWNGDFNFVDPQSGWAVARTEREVALVHTTDGGRTWEMLQPALQEQ